LKKSYRFVSTTAWKGVISVAKAKKRAKAKKAAKPKAKKVVKAKVKCAAKSKAGNPCRNYADGRSKYCKLHQRKK